MRVSPYTLLVVIGTVIHSSGFCQNIEKIFFDRNDSTNGYYLAVAPQSRQVKSALVLFSSFLPPESILPETKLHNVACANDMLTIIVSANQKLYADSITIQRINKILKDVVTRFAADPSKFALAGYNEAGNIVLRYTELTYEHPSDFLVQPKAVFGIDCPVDLFGLWHWSEKQIKKNYWPGAVGDANYYITTMTKENGTIYNHPENYKKLTPFDRQLETEGNEKFLAKVAVRLYYDTDIVWQLKNRRNSFYDTNIPDGSELINRLLISGNQEAALITSKQPGMRSNGLRHPNALSIVDEVDCVQWIKKSLDIFDANTWTAPYHFTIPPGWPVEHFSLPPDFASQMTYKGVEDLRFTPGWDDSTSAFYWSYAYTWWLDGKPRIDANSLTENLKIYYEGLVGRNIISRKIPANKQVPTRVSITKINAAESDSATYNGQVHMLDYMTGKPIILNILVHILNESPQDHTIVLIAISPQPLTHPVWKQFNKLVREFYYHQ